MGMNTILQEFKIQINKGIIKPIRGRWRTKVIEAIRAMNEGDSFEIPTQYGYQQTGAIAKSIGAKMSGHKIEGRDSYRIWLDEAPTK